jgi:hypothetical protein
MDEISHFNSAAIAIVSNGSNYRVTDAFTLLVKAIRKLRIVANEASSLDGISGVHWRLEIQSYPISWLNQCNESSAVSGDVSRLDLARCPPNSLPAFDVLFDYRLTSCNSSEMACHANCSSSALVLVGALLLYNLGTLHTLFAKDLACDELCASDLYAEDTALAEAKVPAYSMEQSMLHAIKLLEKAKELINHEKSLSAKALTVQPNNSVKFLVELGVMNNLAHLYSHFLQAEEVKHCLENMHLPLQEYRTLFAPLSTLGDASIIPFLVEQLILFEMTLFLLGNQHALVAAPAA